MSFDYDLVVIGSTPEGIYAAKKAVLLQARVALVTQSQKERYLNNSYFVNHSCLQEITTYLKKLQSNPWGIWQENITLPKVSFKEIKSYSNLLLENITAENSLAELAVLGVDVIDGQGEFCRLPKQAFLVNNRQLRSRNYLLATGAKYRVKSEYQTQQFNCFTPDDLWQQQLEQLPDHLIIIGASPRSLELAQGLARLGKKVTLATSQARLLPEEIVEVSRLLQAQSAVDGINLLLNAPVKQIKVLDHKTWIQLGDRALEVEAIIVTDTRQPNITNLNLEGVGVKFVPEGILVNEKLQTTNQSIYACGDLLGGHSLPHIAQYEVDIALKNSFSFPIFQRNYNLLPKIILTQPNIARVGLTEIKNQSQSDIYLVKQHFKTNLAAQITGTITGWCQFIIKANGEILGCTIIGDRAIELINIVSIMMRQKIKLNRNPIAGLLTQDIPYVTPSYSEIFNQITISFQQQKLQRDRKLKNRLATWFQWRR